MATIEPGLERPRSLAAAEGGDARDRWSELEAQADRPEVQREIRAAIRRGLIRVAPRADGGIRIIVS